MRLILAASVGAALDRLLSSARVMAFFQSSWVSLPLPAFKILSASIGTRTPLIAARGSSLTLCRPTASRASRLRILSNALGNAPLGGVDSKDSLLGANQIQGSFGEAALGVMDRLVLSDAVWERMAPLIIGRPDQKGSTGRDNRMFVEGVLWIVRTGSPWRDLPEAFGDWNSVFRRFSRWSIKGVWWRIFEAVSDDPDFEYLIVDSTIVRAHQHAAGAKKGGLKIRRSAARAAA